MSCVVGTAEQGITLLHFRHDCRQALEEKLTLLGDMLKALVPDPDDRRTLRTLFVGRLVLTFPEFAQRMAMAASDHRIGMRNGLGKSRDIPTDRFFN